MAKNIFLLCLVGLALSFVEADQVPLQDFCVAQPGAVFVNGVACKDPKTVRPDDFFFKGLDNPGSTSNPFGSAFTPVTVAQLPGLNTLGISLARLDYAPLGLSVPHTHPRATEIVTVLEGNLEVGFVTSFPDSRLFTKVLQKGDVFVLPIGLIHYQRNPSNSSTTIAITALNSQNPGLIPVANAVFGSTPPISIDVLAKSFLVDSSIANQIQAKFQTKQ